MRWGFFCGTGELWEAVGFKFAALPADVLKDLCKRQAEDVSEPYKAPRFHVRERAPWSAAFRELTSSSPLHIGWGASEGLRSWSPGSELPELRLWSHRRRHLAQENNTGISTMPVEPSCFHSWLALDFKEGLGFWEYDLSTQTSFPIQ